MEYKIEVGPESQILISLFDLTQPTKIPTGEKTDWWFSKVICKLAQARPDKAIMLSRCLHRPNARLPKKQGSFSLRIAPQILKCSFSDTHHIPHKCASQFTHMNVPTIQTHIFLLPSSLKVSQIHCYLISPPLYHNRHNHIFYLSQKFPHCRLYLPIFLHLFMPNTPFFLSIPDWSILLKHNFCMPTSVPIFLLPHPNTLISFTQFGANGDFTCK